MLRGIFRNAEAKSLNSAISGPQAQDPIRATSRILRIISPEAAATGEAKAKEVGEAEVA